MVIRVVICRRVSASGPGLSPLEQGVTEGENPVYGLASAAYDTRSSSRVAWDRSLKWVVNFI